MPVGSQSKMDRVLDNSAKAWQDNILVVTRGSPEEHATELEDFLNRFRITRL